MDINGIIGYTMQDGFEMVEEFSGDGKILEDVIRELREDGNRGIWVRFYDVDE